jgi:phosphate transport system permease protein
VKRRIGIWTWTDAALLGASAAAAISLVWIIYERLTPGAGGVGFWFCAFVAFLLTYWLIVRETEGSFAATDRMMTVGLLGVTLLVVATLGLILGDIAIKGGRTLRPGFFSSTMRSTGPLSKATDGGAFHSIIGTLEQVGLAMLLSVPLAILTAVYLNEIGGHMARVVRMVVDAMSGIPGIVAGLFIYAVWVLRFGFSGLAASFALAILMLPTITRTAEEVLRLVPGGLREAALGLGAPRWRTTWRVVLPTARSGIITAVLLGVARAIGDTAALIATTAGLDSLNGNPLHGQQDSLPLFVFKQVKVGLLQSQTQRAETGALVLVGMVLVLFVAARIIGRPKVARG